MTRNTKIQKSSQAVAVCDESRMHGGNGGDGETQVKLCALCLPTLKMADYPKAHTQVRPYTWSRGMS
jgi:hypothetical protein